jgi:hypothetical protein
MELSDATITHTTSLDSFDLQSEDENAYIDALLPFLTLQSATSSGLSPDSDEPATICPKEIMLETPKLVPTSEDNNFTFAVEGRRAMSSTVFRKAGVVVALKSSVRLKQKQLQQQHDFQQEEQQSQANEKSERPQMYGVILGRRRSRDVRDADVSSSSAYRGSPITSRLALSDEPDLQTAILKPQMRKQRSAARSKGGLLMGRSVLVLSSNCAEDAEGCMGGGSLIWEEGMPEEEDEDDEVSGGFDENSLNDEEENEQGSGDEEEDDYDSELDYLSYDEEVIHLSKRLKTADEQYRLTRRYSTPADFMMSFSSNLSTPVANLRTTTSVTNTTLRGTTRRNSTIPTHTHGNTHSPFPSAYSPSPTPPPSSGNPPNLNNLAEFLNSPTPETLHQISQILKTLPKDPSTALFYCPLSSCRRSFGRRFNLQAHFATHLDVREFGCPVCGRGFARRYDMKRHVRTHLNNGGNGNGAGGNGGYQHQNQFPFKPAMTMGAMLNANRLKGGSGDVGGGVGGLEGGELGDDRSLTAENSLGGLGAVPGLTLLQGGTEKERALRALDMLEKEDREMKERRRVARVEARKVFEGGEGCEEADDGDEEGEEEFGADECGEEEGDDSVGCRRGGRLRRSARNQKNLSSSGWSVVEEENEDENDLMEGTEDVASQPQCNDVDVKEQEQQQEQQQSSEEQQQQQQQYEQELPSELLVPVATSAAPDSKLAPASPGLVVDTSLAHSDSEYSIEVMLSPYRSPGPEDNTDAKNEMMMTMNGVMEVMEVTGLEADALGNLHISVGADESVGDTSSSGIPKKKRKYIRRKNISKATTVDDAPSESSYSPSTCPTTDTSTDMEIASSTPDLCSSSETSSCVGSSTPDSTMAKTSSAACFVPSPSLDSVSVSGSDYSPAPSTTESSLFSPWSPPQTTLTTSSATASLPTTTTMNMSMASLNESLSSSDGSLGMAGTAKGDNKKRGRPLGRKNNKTLLREVEEAARRLIEEKALERQREREQMKTMEVVELTETETIEGTEKKKEKMKGKVGRKRKVGDECDEFEVFSGDVEGSLPKRVKRQKKVEAKKDDVEVIVLGSEMEKEGSSEGCSV